MNKRKKPDSENDSSLSEGDQKELWKQQVEQSLKGGSTELCSFVFEWYQQMTDPEERKQFLQAVHDNKSWDTTEDVLRLELMLEDATFSSLIKQLPLETDHKKRGSYRYEGSNSICVDDVRDRYDYVMEKLSGYMESNENYEIYQSLLMQQEKLRFKTLLTLETYNESLKEIHDKMTSKGFKSEFKKISYFSLFPDEKEPKNVFPLDQLNASTCGTPAVYLELAFDILTIGWPEIKRNRDVYYRVCFSYN